MSSRKRLSTVLLLVATVVISFLLFSLLRRETHESVATKSFAAVQDGDGETFLQHMSEQERSAYGLTAEQWTAILREYVKPVMDDWKVVTGKENSFMERVDMYSKEVTFAGPGGRLAKLRVEAARTNDGPRVVGLARNLVYCVATMKYGDSNLQPDRLRNMYAARKAYLNDAAKLDALGLHGGYLMDRKRVVNRAELVRTYDSLITKYEARFKDVGSAKAPENAPWVFSADVAQAEACGPNAD
jgi:hypothetical protein